MAFQVQRRIKFEMFCQKRGFGEQASPEFCLLLKKIALTLYRKRKLSLGKAAELAGYNKVDFIKKLKQENEYVFDYNTDELDEIMNDADGIGEL